ncbi:MAG: FkbM family methyltransferase [Desulfovermiculus sp.]|nr:FkbM family methyltransferase [Desulfovermiculus sp.]
MFVQQVKTKLIRMFGYRPVAALQAIRFIYLLLVRQTPDPEVNILPFLIGKGDITIDVGANGADWTYWLYRNTGRVFAFEADPYYALSTSLAIKLMRLKGVQLFPFGLSEINEKLPLVVSANNGSRLSGLSHINRYASKKSAIEVELKQLDSLVEEWPELSAAKLIKCDAEGYELFVFRGAEEIIQRVRPYIIFEIGNFGIHGYSAKEIFDFFVARDYASYALIHDKILGKTDQMLEHKEAVSVNRMMIPKEKLNTLKGKVWFKE